MKEKKELKLLVSDVEITREVLVKLAEFTNDSITKAWIKGVIDILDNLGEKQNENR